MGASITAKEIFQQPGLWQEAYQLYVSQLEAIESFLSGIKEKHDLIQVILPEKGHQTLLVRALQII